MAIVVEALSVALLDGSKSFVWSLRDSRTGQRVDIEGRTGDYILRDTRGADDIGLELSSVAGALSEWCDADQRHYQSANWKKMIDPRVRRTR